MALVTTKKLEKAKKIYADDEHPVLLCLTCGIATRRIHIKYGDSLRGYYKRKYRGKRSWKRPQKRWRRTIKASKLRKTIWGKQEVRMKEIYYSYDLIKCLKKKHCISIRKASFWSTMVNKLIV